VKLRVMRLVLKSGRRGVPERELLNSLWRVPAKRALRTLEEEGHVFRAGGRIFPTEAFIPSGRLMELLREALARDLSKMQDIMEEYHAARCLNVPPGDASRLVANTLSRRLEEWTASMRPSLGS